MSNITVSNSLELDSSFKTHLLTRSVVMSVDSSSGVNEWSCDECTYINVENSLTCVMCYRVRVSSCHTASAHWQWRANESQFITFDALANATIENAFKSGADDADVVTSNGSTYRIVFSADGAGHYQQNKHNGAQREVRRIGKNSADIFVAAPADADTKCAICQCELSDASDDVYRLRVCAPGHAFHGDCVVSWVMIHPRCPVCQTPIA